MPALEPGKIRNVAVVGHRGTGKTSLVEALLFQAGASSTGSARSRPGTTVSDWDEDEQQRRDVDLGSRSRTPSGRAARSTCRRAGRPELPGRRVAALRVVEGALFVVSGVMGVEVQTARLWQRAEELGLARVVFVNMLDRERADFFRALEAAAGAALAALRRRPPADRQPSTS